MRDDISSLMRLQQLDQQLRESQQALSQITTRIDDLRAQATQNKDELELEKAEDRQALLQRNEVERSLAEGEAQIRNKRMRLSLVKNDRELLALTHEVEALKENNQQLEADLLMRMESAEQRTPRIAELTEALNKLETELKQTEKDVAAQVEALTAEVAKRKAERDEVARSIDPVIRRRYELIFNRRNGLAVVVAKSGTCQGCRMRIPPQLYNEIQKNLSIHFCPNCQRILYFDS